MKIFRLLIVLFIVSCTKKQSILYLKKTNTNYTIYIKKETKYMSHDLFSLFDNDTYFEYNQFKVPVKSKILMGKDIKVNPGQYKSKGEIIIKPSIKISINLITINTDDKIETPDFWNGTYIYQKNNIYKKT